MILKPTAKLKKPVDPDILKALSLKLKATQVRVGYPKEAQARYPASGESVLDVAIWNEFGTEHIPERSFVRSAFTLNARKYRDMGRKLSQQVINRMASKEATDQDWVQQAMKVLGLVAVDDIQQQISRTVFPPNKAGTIKAKGSSHPLIDTGLLRQSTTFIVEETP